MNTHSAQYIVGPTASGKSELAHVMARDLGWRILSADSMNIYHGMDVGTAKPTLEMRNEVAYLGLDLVSPGEPFSVSAYIEAAREILSNPEPVLVCGGTGLYLKALSEGLESGPEPDPAKRRDYENKLDAGGVESLREELGHRSPRTLEALNDPDNPRRLIRALERLDAGMADVGTWGGQDPGLITGIRVPHDLLHQRIGERAEQMFAGGLLEEVRAILDSGTGFSATAAQAIGYREALDAVAGRVTRDEAVERTALRTRQLVKKQLTWFRNKMNITWIDWDGQEDPGILAEKFRDVWAQHEHGIIRF